MKKTLLIIALAVFATLTANAQFFVGGTLGFESNSKGGDGPQSSFSLSPEAVYLLNDNFGVGLLLDYTFEKAQDNSKYNTFTFQPYAGYSLLQFGKFHVAAMGGVYIAFESLKLDGANDAASATIFGMRAWPKLLYLLNDNIVLHANLNFASFSFSSTNPENGDSITHFGLGVDSYDAINTGNIQIGFMYKF